MDPIQSETEREAQVLTLLTLLGDPEIPDKAKALLVILTKENHVLRRAIKVVDSLGAMC